jgi:Spy/CpxP family protein refolding chaperone
MKLYTKTLAAALCAGGLGLAMGAQAQPGPGGEQQGMHGFHHRGGHHGGLRALNLTEAQRDQIFKIHHDQAPAFREQMKKVRASREELRKLASADKLDQAAVRRAADAQAKALSDMAVLRVQAASQVRAVLTPEQKAKLDQMHERRHRS